VDEAFLWRNHHQKNGTFQSITAYLGVHVAKFFHRNLVSEKGIMLKGKLDVEHAIWK
jgi:hypothetical protein